MYRGEDHEKAAKSKSSARPAIQVHEGPQQPALCSFYGLQQGDTEGKESYSAWLRLI